MANLSDRVSFENETPFELETEIVYEIPCAVNLQFNRKNEEYVNSL